MGTRVLVPRYTVYYSTTRVVPYTYVPWYVPVPGYIRYILYIHGRYAASFLFPPAFRLRRLPLLSLSVGVLPPQPLRPLFSAACILLFEICDSCGYKTLTEPSLLLKTLFLRLRLTPRPHPRPNTIRLRECLRVGGRGSTRRWPSRRSSSSSSLRCPFWQPK